MSFIHKDEPTILNIKLTDAGREQLAKGSLNFSQFAIGDSEINYKFINDNNFNPSNFNILRPFDKNTKQLSFITKTLSGSSLNTLRNIQSTPTSIQNSTAVFGFFNNSGTTATLLVTPNLVKQPDMMVRVNEINGGITLNLYKSSQYGSTLNEPNVNDYIMIRWSNPNGISTSNYNINQNVPMPCLFYKIESIVSGSLAGNNLVVTVDKELPDFNGLGSGINCGVYCYYNNYSASGNTPYYTTDFISDSVFSFMENVANVSNNTTYWNMSVVFTEELAGILSTNRKYGTFNTAGYSGFVSYIQNQNPINKILGIIHYDGLSPQNTYGEELYLNTPVLNIPTIMWHKSSTSKLGVKLIASGNQKLLTGETISLNTRYYDLIDEDSEIIVGKIFNDLKLFVIEDQELLFAMSYKSNRSWTLPDPIVGFNAVVSSCPQCSIQATVTKTDITTGTGSISVSNVVSGGVAPIFLEIRLTGSTTPIYFSRYTGNTTVSGLTEGNYVVTVYDMSSSNCYASYDIEIINIYNASWSQLTSGTVTQLRSVSFVDDNTGWVAGTNALIRKTTNGGANWITQGTPINSSHTIKSIYFNDVNNGWACSDAGMIVLTTNGGSNWNVGAILDISISLNSIYFINNNIGWACGSGGSIYKSTNAGFTWTLQNGVSSSSLNSIYFIDANNGWACGNDGTILHSIDGGVNWSAQTTNITSILNSIYFVDVNNGWACGANGVILRTINGGTTWSAQTSTVPNTLYSIKFLNLNEGWAVGGTGVVILHTTNGGTTWTYQINPTSNLLYSIDMISNVKGWACGFSGIIIKYS